jgi:hypothetical protein
MMLLCRILCFAGIVLLAYVIFSKPREILIETPAEEPRVSNSQVSNPQPVTRPRPGPGQIRIPPP